MDFKSYPNYKDSGVEWLGEVPADWQVIPSKFYFTERQEKAELADKQLTASQKFGIVFQEDYMAENGRVMVVIKNPEILKKVRPKDFVISMRSFQGGLELSNLEGCISSAYVMLKPNLELVDTGYYKYLFKSPRYIQALQSTSTLIRDGQALRFNNFSQVKLVLPPKEEQTKIVSFLDSETSRIDNLIAKQEKLIEVLEEHRNTLTAHTIEKGINPDIKMINSGVEWLGEVPENWKIGRLKNFAKVNPIIKKFSLDADELVEFIPMSNVDDKKGVIASIDYRKFGEVSTGYTAFNTSDVVFAKITPCMENGNCAIIPELKHGFGYGTTEFIVFRASKEIKTEFLYFLLRSKKLRDICTAFMTGTAGQQRISSDFLANYPLALPDLKEQQEIIDFLHEKNQKIDTLIAKQRELITKLKNYRTSIISHAVTGKIDVRDLVA
ncbi:type I restriction modification DNA specificity domain protein [Acinetobacter baumannii 1412924]|uniref:restriction endonuclease subunit S n=1 Tax=Acinetobacter baumannii TaxID=470 RepID=UPI00044AB840|nr:restriction endonuclease subunit S [Acinetobacter baumannii]EXH48334.1 type I restriction modification DNA specificity domain protein [Acinetobacter baumannii 1412924]